MRSTLGTAAAAALLGAAGCAQLTGLSALDSSGCEGCDGGATLDATPDGAPALPPGPGAEAGALETSSGADTSVPGTTPPDAGVPEAEAPDAPAADVTNGPCPGTAGPAAVHVGSFCIDSTEITNDQYAIFLAAAPALSLAPLPACSFKASFVPTASWPASTAKKQNPVVYVDWCDAYAYCAWAGKRLCGAIAGGPSSKASSADKNIDQWYVACSSAGANLYPYGGNAYVAGKCNDSESNTNGTRPVASFAGCVGGYSGIFDMNGNAYEWEDACDVSAGASDSCVLRGGSWLFAGATYGGCNTYFNDYIVKRSDNFNDTGFRCCSR